MKLFEIWLKDDPEGEGFYVIAASSQGARHILEEQDILGITEEAAIKELPPEEDFSVVYDYLPIQGRDVPEDAQIECLGEDDPDWWVSAPVSSWCRLRSGLLVGSAA